MANFFVKLFSLFTSANTPEGKKKKQMKQLAKEISHNRFSKFYKPKNKEITGEFAAFIYDIYKVIAPAQNLLQNAPKSAMLKQIVVESFFDEETNELRKILDCSIEDWAKLGEVSVVTKTINEYLMVFSAAFDSDQIKNINYCYSNILAMINFITYDYYALLKRFSVEFRERNFKYAPRFVNNNDPALSVRLKDFLEVASAIGNYSDWEQVIKIMIEYRKDVVVLGSAVWMKIIDKLHYVCNSGILEKMIKHIDDNPFWQFKVKYSNESIAKEYLDKKQSEVKGKLDKLINFQKQNRKAMLLNNIFSKKDINRMQFYTVSNGEIFTKKNFKGFIYAEAINYFLAFMIDIFGKEIKELCDILIIRAAWIAQESYLEMSDCYHQLQEMAENIITFDNKVADSGVYGSRLSSSINIADKNNAQARIVSSTLALANNDALELITVGIRLILSIGNSFKALLDDRRNSVHMLVKNWQELDYIDPPVVESIKNSSAKISDFIQLMISVTGDDIDMQLNQK